MSDVDGIPIDRADSFILPKSAMGREPQHLLLTLLGDYWRGRQEMIPSSALVELLAEFDVTEVSARQAMRRLRNRDLLVQEKIGRQTYYGTPEYVAGPSMERRRRVLRFGFDFLEWDGLWTVVTFSIPERERDVRRQLRHRLAELKFGMLQDAVWVSPHHRAEQMIEILASFGVVDASVMRAEIIERPGFERSFSEVFGLAELNVEYRQFAEQFEPMVELVNAGKVAPSDALVLRTEVMSNWLQFRRSDPALPAELLPADWERSRAREVTYRIYDDLGAAAEARFKQVLGNHDRDLAQLVSHHTSRDM